MAPVDVGVVAGKKAVALEVAERYESASDAVAAADFPIAAFAGDACKSAPVNARLSLTYEEAADPEVVAAAERLSGRRAYRFVKRVFDIAFSLLVLACFCWLLAIIAIAVKVDDPKGPVLFGQRRVTKDGREFTMYKFRSMCADAEEHLVELRAFNEKNGPVFKMRDDPRVTHVGRLLRRASLDELPQFWNVLRGDMSVVGPRPALPAEVAAYTPRQRQRLLVKGGVTCFWQVTPGRDSVPFDEWVEMDLRYVRECGLWTDLKLIARTVGCVLTAQGN